MKVTVFTSNQPRHLSLIAGLAEVVDQVYAVQECNTVFPGKVNDFFNQSDVMQQYFSRVIAAEEAVFGRPRFLPSNVHQLALKMGDLSLLKLDALAPAMDADHFVVFGASYIKGDLIDTLVERNAINIHMGVSPYFRGSSCNFWAAYTGRIDLVGSTIHVLSKGLDSGGMLMHALPKPQAVDPFEFGMRAVKSAHQAYKNALTSGALFTLEPVVQNKNLEIKYTRNEDFTDEVASDYLEHLPSPGQVLEVATKRGGEHLIRAQFN